MVRPIPHPCRLSPGQTAAERASAPIRVALLTGGDDKSYSHGLTHALTSQGVEVDFIGSDSLDAPELRANPRVRFLNLRGSQNEQVSVGVKIQRIITYYARLVIYAYQSDCAVFHILWNNKFEFIDRVLLMICYRLLGKRLVMTAHNVNAAKRDNRDSFANRWTLRIQYRLTHHIFVHTRKMKQELHSDFQIPDSAVTIIPFGINSVFPLTAMTTEDAKQSLLIRPDEKTILFFGQIAPYKGLQHLVKALSLLTDYDNHYRLIIAGKVKQGHSSYWENIENEINSSPHAGLVIKHIKFIPESEVELYFKAADVLVIPYVHIFQSGVPFLAFNYGLPVIATDVGCLKEDIFEGKNGFVCSPEDPTDLARAIRTYFSHRLYENLAENRSKIRSMAMERHSWDTVGNITRSVYTTLCHAQSPSPI